MSNTRAILVAFVAAATLGACKKTSDGNMEVKTPTVDVGTKTDTVGTPTMPNVDVGTKKDTMIVTKPTISVNKDTAKKRKH